MKEHEVVLKFFESLMPKEWRSNVTFDPQFGQYRFSWDWIRTPDGKCHSPKSDAKGVWLYVDCLISMDEVLRPPMNDYNRAIYVLAHKADPPIELSEHGRRHLGSLARAMIESGKKVT